MTVRVGLIGCGQISGIYLRNAPLFESFKVTACADVLEEKAKSCAQTHGIQVMSVDALLADGEIDAVLNLTVPNAHAAVSLAALDAGKHVYSEKPLATSVADARAVVDAAAVRGLAVASAPDTVLGPATDLALQLIHDGAIGTPLLATAAVMGHGMEHWHPNPAFFYAPGGGPVFDVGPYYLASLNRLLGNVASITALSQIGNPSRMVTTPGSPVHGSRIEPIVPTTTIALLQYERGAQASVMFSWDVWRHGVPPIEVHGAAGSLRLPDPNWFGGDVLLSRAGGDWEVLSSDAVPYGTPNYENNRVQVANYRGLGIEKMARAILCNEIENYRGHFGLHPVETMAGIVAAGSSGEVITVFG